jgi:hypothetical protein
LGFFEFIIFKLIGQSHIFGECFEHLSLLIGILIENFINRLNCYLIIIIFEICFLDCFIVKYHLIKLKVYFRFQEGKTSLAIKYL